jgi:hypothetical protein
LNGGMTRTLRPLAVLALVTLLSAGCSNATARTDTTSANASDRDQALKFAACMRRSGVSAFRDPPASGTLTIDGVANGSSLDTDSAAFTQAIAACKDLQPAGFTGHKRTAQQQESALKFAQCVRDNGVPDFPDPTPDGPLLNVDGSKPGLKAALDVALPKCREFAANAGVVGGR